MPRMYYNYRRFQLSSPNCREHAQTLLISTVSSKPNIPFDRTSTT